MQTLNDNVRHTPLFQPRFVLVRILAAIVRLADRFFPEMTARWLEQRFFRPDRRRSAMIREALPEGRTTFWVRTTRNRVRAFSWGEHGPLVLLVHGWEGNASSFAVTVRRLLAAGYRVAAFDASAHGESSGETTDMLEFGEAIGAVLERTGTPFGVVAHSLGGPASALYFFQHPEHEPAAYVMVAPAAEVPDMVRRFVGFFGLGRGAAERLGRRIVRRFKRELEHYSVPAAVRGFKAHGLILHDVDDSMVPLEHGRRIAAAWPGARMIATCELGHSRILRDNGVIDHIIEFFKTTKDARTPLRAAG